MDLEFSDELLKRIERLTPKQRRAIPRLVRARAEGMAWKAIFESDARPCNWRTYWDRKRGWRYQPSFSEALAQAQREYDAAVLRTSVQDAAEGLRKAAPLATELLQMVVLRALAAAAGGGVERGEAGRALEGMLTDEKRKLAAAGRLLTEDGRITERGLRAALGVLDRADIETAVKGLSGADERWAALLAELRGDGDEKG